MEPPMSIEDLNAALAKILEARDYPKVVVHPGRRAEFTTVAEVLGLTVVTSPYVPRDVAYVMARPPVLEPLEMVFEGPSTVVHRHEDWFVQEKVTILSEIRLTWPPEAGA